MSEVSSGE
uniref:Dystrophin n=4 Tax=Hominidae TaxID=9604 RepID=Q7JK32_PANTR